MGVTMSDLLWDPPSESEMQARLKHQIHIMERKIKVYRDQGDDSMAMECYKQLEYLRAQERTLVKTAMQRTVTDITGDLTRYYERAGVELENQLVEQAVKQPMVMGKLDMVLDGLKDQQQEIVEEGKDRLEREEDDIQYMCAALLPTAPGIADSKSSHPTTRAYVSL